MYIESHPFQGKHLDMSVTPLTVTKYASRMTRLLSFLLHDMDNPLYVDVDGLLQKTVTTNISVLLIKYTK